MRGHAEVRLALQEADVVYINPIVLGELRSGFARGARLRKNESELRAFLDAPRVTVVSIDEATAERYAVILNALWKAGTPVPTNDIWIAASAMQHGLALLTTDRHYTKVSQVVARCFEP
jgi:predicted nucleic acid-binding protein